MSRYYSNTKEPYPEKGVMPVKECQGMSPICLHKFIETRDHPNKEDGRSQEMCIYCLDYYGLIDEGYTHKKPRIYVDTSLSTGEASLPLDDLQVEV